MDKTIFEVEISNSGPKSYETATVMKMPASFAEFSDALQKARIKDGSFCKNELTCIHYNGLTHAMIGWNATESPLPRSSAGWGRIWLRTIFGHCCPRLARPMR